VSGGQVSQGAGPRDWTEEQRQAIAQREGDLLLDAAAGSGKTSVLVERFVESVLQDGLDVTAILTITFTEKAAAEMRERIRRRLREVGQLEAARATEGAHISTIHGFCARLLRAQALSAGIDPRFHVLDAWEAGRLADEAFDRALDEVAQAEPGALDLIAAYTPGGLRGAILSTYGQLRSRGQLVPGLPPLGSPPDLEAARERLEAASAAAARELATVDRPSRRVLDALGRLESCSGLIEAGEPWPASLSALSLPGGNGAALSTPVCQQYGEALAEFRTACEHRWAGRAHDLLDKLLGAFAVRYAEHKRLASGLDFEDLELLALELVRGHPELREGLRSRFARIMVDELQDTNHVQMELIEQLATGNLFTVGDALQSIYGFRHADVELFESRGRRLEEIGARGTLRTNFRSRPEILEVVNRAFWSELGEGFRPLEPGRDEASNTGPRVELIVADKGADWDYDGPVSAWRVAEAQALGDRVAELMQAGDATPGDTVVLLRASTDMRVYERALEDRGIPTYVIGGRGYWAHPQVVDMVAYLRALANPRDLEALYTVLASPLVGVSLDTLVILAAAGRSADRDPWWLMSDPEDRLDELDSRQREMLERFAGWFGRERAAAARLRVEQLIDRALAQTAYDDAVLALPGGQRRMANLRKLMRLGSELGPSSGDPLREFLELVRFRSGGWGGDRTEAEAPVEGEGLEAVRLMTIHRAKGLEFGTVCVADLGRAPFGRAELMRIGRDGRFGLRLSQPGTARAEGALDYKALGDEQAQAEAAEERRLFYVAMTRARERLVLSGAVKLDPWYTGVSGGPMTWIGPALVPEAAELAEGRKDGIADRVCHGVAVRFIDSEGVVFPVSERAGPGTARPAPEPDAELMAALVPPPAAGSELAISEVSYTALEEHRRCGYRFYVERMLGLAPVETGGVESRVGEAAGNADRPARPGLGAAERGVLVHGLLERIDFRRPAVPDLGVAAAALATEEAEEIRGLVQAFTDSEICRRLGRATTVRSEQEFSFLLGQDGARAPALLIRGVFDVLAQERTGQTLVVDYKTDRLGGADPEAVVQRSYAVQRLVYALAALRSGARRVEVVHAFLELVDHPAVAAFDRDRIPELEAELTRLTADMAGGRFEVSPVPHRALCHGCPAEGGLCSWSLAQTRRGTPDQLF
jgi:ATP-dependent exoDNAse (exonuclease V) beta subunit